MTPSALFDYSNTNQTSFFYPYQKMDWMHRSFCSRGYPERFWVHHQSYQIKKMRGSPWYIRVSPHFAFLPFFVIFAFFDAKTFDADSIAQKSEKSNSSLRPTKHIGKMLNKVTNKFFNSFLFYGIISLINKNLSNCQRLLIGNI